MIWQDITITVIMIAFSYALIPQIIKGFKNKKSLIALQTALINSAGMIIVGITYITLNLYFSATMSIIGGTLWAILLIQSKIYN